MKVCPACKTQYSDDTLYYCLQDGSPLVGASGADTPTVVLGETETWAARGGHGGILPVGDSRSQQWQPTQVTRIASRQTESRGLNTPIAVALTVVGMLLLFGVVGIGAWLYLKSGQTEVAKNTFDSPTPANQNLGANSLQFPNSNSTPSATRPPATPPVGNTIDFAKPPVDDSRIRGEVSQRINSWKSQAESLNLNAYMSHYAGSVDYYRKAGATAAFVRADKQRAFSRYSSMRVDISNESVTIDASGQTATAVFDKEWEFQGNGRSTGKVRQMMRLNKIGGQWLITAEKDLKLYYKR